MKKTIAIVSVLVVVFLCSSFPAFAQTVTVEENYSNNNTYLDGDIQFEVTSIVYKPYLVSYDYDFVIGRTYYGTSMNPYPSAPYNWNSSDRVNLYQVDCEVIVNGKNFNSDSLAYGNSSSYNIRPNFNFDVQPVCYYVDVNSDDVQLFYVSAGEFRFKPINQNFNYKGRVCLPADSNWAFSFTIHFLYTYDIGMQNGTTTVQTSGTSMNQLDYIDVTSIEINYPTAFTATSIYSSANEIVNWWRLDQWLEIISSKIPNSNQAYIDNRQDSIDVGTNSNAAQTQSDTNHQTELSYFNQTNTALTNSGISNYQFDNEQIGGIGSVSNDFTSVWNSLGSWTSVYIFSLTLSLGLAIIRHVRPIHRSNEE